MFFADKKHKKKKFRQNNNNQTVGIVDEKKIKIENSELLDEKLDSKIGIVVENNSQNISTTAAITEIMDDKDNSDANVSASGRAQRTRKKPKRWDNDELEVDFSGGKLNIINNTQDDSKMMKRDEPPVKKAKKSDKPKLIIVESSRIKKEEIHVEEEKSVKKESDEESVSDKNDEDSSNDDENDSNFDSDDDPEKLWSVHQSNEIKKS